MRSAPDEEYAQLFPQIYRLLHRRVEVATDRVTPQSWAILQHLEMSGPLTVSEMTRHFNRAQSVVSEIVAQLEQRDLLRRTRDPRDRRRTLVWLTDGALVWLQRHREVLDRGRLREALGRMARSERSALLRGTAALVRAAEAARQDALSPPAAAPGATRARRRTGCEAKHHPGSESNPARRKRGTAS